VEQPGLGFGGLLRQLREAAQLTQEELAEAASLSPRSVSDLERGINRTARKDTAVLLAGALNLAGQARELFVAAARGRGPAEAVLAARQGVAPGAFAASATRALPRDMAAFTGRRAELAQLMATLTAAAVSGGVVGIHAIDGMPGIGKTTFAVHAAHQLASRFPDGQFFLQLHAHTAGQQPVDPADALASLLLTVGVAAQQIPPDLQARAGLWRDHVAGKKILLVLDDAAGHQQVRPLLPGTAGSLVLVTSRRRLAALEDATVISLDVLPAADAVALLARLAARPGLHAEDAAGEMALLCGYLPLAIGMLASQLRHHPARSASQLAADLAAARDRLAMMRAEDLSAAAAFDLSYADLTAGPQRLFRRLGLVPGPSVDAYAAAALDDTGLHQARRHLNELYDQHLLTEPAPGRYQLHDLLREHARALADADNPAGRHAATDRLLDYYLSVALAADRHIPTWDTVYRRLPLVRCPGDVPDLSTVGQAAAWLEAERPNLHAAADYAAASGRHLHAVQIPAAMGGFLRTRGHWDQAAALHQMALTAARHAGDRAGQAGTLHEVGLMRTITGDYPAAADSLAQAVALYADIGDQAGQAYALCQLAAVQGFTGDCPADVTSYEQALALARGSGDQRAEACALQMLGWAQQAAGDYPAAAANLADALALYQSMGHRLGQAETLLTLGKLDTLTGDYPAADASIRQALEIFCDLGDRPQQAWAVNELGMAQQLSGDYSAAAASHQHALELFHDLGDRLGQAEALNRLGALALRMTATGQARERYTRALVIARDLGVLPEKARALEGIGNSHLQDGNPGQAAQYLRQALAIYRRISVPAARRVEETLRQPRPQPANPQPAPLTPIHRAGGVSRDLRQHYG